MFVNKWFILIRKCCRDF